MTTAYVTMETGLEITSRGTAAIVFQSLATADFTQIVRDMEEVVRATAADSATTVETSEDSYGFSWLVLRGKSFDDLVVGINAVSTAIEGGGYGERLLCAVFAFQDARGRPLYWIYNYKRGAFYPFAPAGQPAARQRARARPQGPAGRRAAGRAGALAVVSPVGNPDLSHARTDPAQRPGGDAADDHRRRALDRRGQPAPAGSGAGSLPDRPAAPAPARSRGRPSVGTAGPARAGPADAAHRSSSLPPTSRRWPGRATCS